MNTYKIVVLTIAFSFIFTSIALAGGISAWSSDHSLRIGVSDIASEKGVRENLPDHIAFLDHSFREGVLIPGQGTIQSTETESGVRGYYRESEVRQDLGITDEGRLLLKDGPAD